MFGDTLPAFLLRDLSQQDADIPLLTAPTDEARFGAVSEVLQRVLEILRGDTDTQVAAALRVAAEKKLLREQTEQGPGGHGSVAP